MVLGNDTGIWYQVHICEHGTAAAKMALTCEETEAEMDKKNMEKGKKN